MSESPRTGDADRDLPESGVFLALVQQVVVQEPALVEPDVPGVFVPVRLSLKDRVAHLLDPGVHNGGNGLAGGLLQGRPQVLRAGVGVLVGGKVAVESLLEGLLAQEGLQHPESGAALAVADGVEELPDLRGILHPGLNWVGVSEPVQAETGIGVLEDELGPHIPLRVLVVDGLVAHPGGEALVEPQVVPPLHCHQVSEPHVRHLVGHHLHDSLPGRRRGVLGVVEQGGLTIGDCAPVLHCARREVRDGYVVQLLQGIRDAEVAVEVVQQSDGVLHCEAPLLLLAPRSPDPHQRPVGGPLLHGGEVAHDERQQVRGHLGRLGEAHNLGVSFRRNLAHNQRVGDSHQV